MTDVFLHDLRDHVERAFGPATWTTLALAAGLPHRFWSEDAAEADATVPGTDEALEGFGRFLFPAVLRSCSSLVDPGWDALDLLEHAERALQAALAEPGSSVLREGDRLVIASASPHRVCALARGVARGVGDHYRTRLEVVEGSCTRRGEDRCVTTVTRAALEVPAPREPGHDEVHQLLG